MSEFFIFVLGVLNGKLSVGALLVRNNLPGERLIIKWQNAMSVIMLLLDPTVPMPYRYRNVKILYEKIFVEKFFNWEITYLDVTVRIRIRFLRRLRSDLPRSLLKERFRRDQKRLKKTGLRN